LKQQFDKRLASIVAENSNALYGGLKGVEKESLRVGPDGSLSPIAHPATLGSRPL
jgi:glutamate--cysteine ligase